MAKENNVKLSWKDKYLSFDKEKRINRMQFFVRSMVFSFVTYFAIYAILYVAPDNYYSVLNTILSIILIIVMFIFFPVMIQKRTHDYGKSGKKETAILLGIATITTIAFIFMTNTMHNTGLTKILNSEKLSNYVEQIKKGGVDNKENIEKIVEDAKKNLDTKTKKQLVELSAKYNNDPKKIALGLFKENKNLVLLTLLGFILNFVWMLYWLLILLIKGNPNSNEYGEARYSKINLIG